MRACPVPFSMQNKIEDELENLEKQGVISKTDR